MARPTSARNAHFASLSPNPSACSSPPWYKRGAEDSDSDGADHNDTQFDFLAGASTPLHVNNNKSMMFISPMKKLGNLHLSPGPPREDQIIYEDINEDIVHEEDDDDDDDDDDDFSAGNKTIHTNSSSELEDQSFMPLDHPAPKFIPQRKRRHTDSPLEMEITPMADDHTIPHGSSGKDMSGLLPNSSYEFLKISFSASDSTPCPSQPRKKLRLKKNSFSEENTPSQPSKTNKPLLDFSSSRKLSASGALLIYKLNDAHGGSDESAKSMETSSLSSGTQNLQSTPISQSTPANSRAPSPGISVEEADESVNGFKFVKPSAKYSYRTPRARPSSTYEASQRLINAYNLSEFSQDAGAYEIVGEFRVSAAGLMDEDAESVHVGDKRINDPYLFPSPASHSSSFNNGDLDLRQKYFESSKLPLLQTLERDLTKDEMLKYINDKQSVLSFYDRISTAEEESSKGRLALLKKERLRWHPDKWVTKYDKLGLDKEIVDNLSQVINGLIDSLQ